MLDSFSTGRKKRGNFLIFSVGVTRENVEELMYYTKEKSKRNLTAMAVHLWDILRCWRMDG